MGWGGEAMSTTEDTGRLQPTKALTIPKALTPEKFLALTPDLMLKKLRASEQARTMYPELYHKDLDWNWNCYSSEVGLKSCSGIEVEYLLEVTGNVRAKGTPAPDLTVNFTGDSGSSGVSDPWATAASLSSFRYGRSVWRRLGELPYSYQSVLAAYYEPRQWRSNRKERCGPTPPPLELVRTAHAAYTGTLDK